MTKETEALKLALEALENISTALREDDVLGSDIELMLDAISAIREAIAGLKSQEPAAWMQEVGCAECGVNGGHALYCVACAEKFDVVVSKAVEHEREECAGIDIPITIPNRDYLDMSPLEIYEEALMDATLSFRAAIRARKNTHPT